MNGSQIREKRTQFGIPGHLVCRKARICRSRLSDIERGYVEPSDAELTRICAALEELGQAKQKLAATAAECGWPVFAL